MHWSRFSLTRLSLFSFNSLNPLQVQLSHAVTESDKAPLGEALCCDVTLVSFLTREGRPWPSTATRDGAAINVAERRQRVAYPELLRPEQRLWLLACEVGGEYLAAFLDDLYVVTVPERAAPLFRVVTGEVERGGDAPPGIAALGPDVWCGDLPPARRGFVALGVPIGHPVFVGAHAAGRLEAEADLLHKLQRLPDLQSAWLLLAYCAAPRAQHLLRNVPPADLLPYARAHDAAIWNVVEGLLGGQGPDEGDAWLAARAVAFLPPSFGGLGLLSAERVSSAAYG
ncbi:unnamed protein product, partial [Symbiodinium microadriaticum]